MQAIRSIYTVENGKLVIELPASFPHTEVEVIILPVAVEDESDIFPEYVIQENHRRLAAYDAGETQGIPY